jgi:nucleoside-diphosphate-sugar epimerase
VEEETSVGPYISVVADDLGKSLIRRLLASHNHITVLDLIFHQDEINAIRRDFPNADSLLKVVQGDILDDEALEDALTDDITGIIHLAAVSRVGWCLENEPDCHDVNVGGTKKVIETMKNKGVKAWFLQASSREVYGNALEFPVPETAPNTPANAYGQTKSDAEAVIQSQGIRAILLRLSNVYGGLADHRERLIPAIITSALSHRTIQMVGGNQDLDMVHIDDVVHGFLAAVRRLEMGEGKGVEAYNIGTGKSASAMAMIKKVLHLSNSSSPLQILPGDNRFPDYYIGTTKKAENELGFKAEVDIDEGIVRFISAFYHETISFIDGKLASTCSTPRTYRTNDLASLDGCSGTIGIDGPGGMEYLSMTANGGDLPAWEWLDTDEIQNWNFHVVSGSDDRVVMTFTQQTGDRDVTFATTEKGHLLGSQSRFAASIIAGTNHVSLKFEDSGNPLVPDHMTDKLRETRYRITPFCCPGKPTPWPFFEEDPFASAVSDTRTGNHRFFNASQTVTMCTRLDAARTAAQSRLDSIKQLARPYQLVEGSLPTGQPHAWRQRGLDHCTNLCDHPTTCLDTGDCACTQSACVARIRYPFTAFANVSGLSYPPPTINWDEVETNDPLILIRKVASSSWLNVLQPHARRYLQSSPSWPDIHLTRLPDEVQSNRDTNWGDFNKLQSTPHGCFSADSVLERGVKLLAAEYKPESLVFMPYFAGTQMVCVIMSHDKS